MKHHRALAAAGLVALSVLLWLHPSLPWNRVTPEKVRASPAKVSEILGSEQVGSRYDMDFLFEAVRMRLQDDLGLQVTSPIRRKWLTQVEVQVGRGPHTQAFTESVSENGVVFGLAINVPLYQPPADTVHYLAHEMGHCWLIERRLDDLPSERSEGFCEWLGDKMLTAMKPAGWELARLALRSNEFKEYSEGFAHFERVERSSGSDAVFQDVTRSAK